MRTNIEIDDKLLSEVMALTGAKTKKQAIHEALLDQLKRRRAIEGFMSLRGKIEWEGDIDAMRRDK
ncbi:type II toxin-antitoxin system VapB family antitoxin [Mesorhizobium sp. IMUNJ 23232]|uniref:type II toxin-antitoxin system VapB family antitoxin n=1 Tax=Mesorhizobium sp. IMUNJ 23232 TaxID=3376064 RepID=UPI00379AFAB9